MTTEVISAVTAVDQDRSSCPGDPGLPAGLG